MKNGWNGRWKMENGIILHGHCQKPWRGSPSGPYEKSAHPTLSTSGLDRLVPSWLNFRIALVIL
jgi:hypothetical protein